MAINHKKYNSWNLNRKWKPNKINIHFYMHNLAEGEDFTPFIVDEKMFD